MRSRISSILLGLSSSKTLVTPDVFSLRPSMISSVVVLPAPFSPSSPNISPRLTSNEMSLTAVKSPYSLMRSLTSITTSSLNSAPVDQARIRPGPAVARTVSHGPAPAQSLGMGIPRRRSSNEMLRAPMDVTRTIIQSVKETKGKGRNLRKSV